MHFSGLSRTQRFLYSPLLLLRHLLPLHHLSGGNFIFITDDAGTLLANIRLGWKELQDTTVYLAVVSIR